MMLPEISAEALEKHELEKYFPEVYALEGDFENNPWHDKEDFFKHTCSVVRTLENVIGEHPRFSPYLSERIVQTSRRVLLLLAALYHDSGKRKTVKQFEDGLRECPGHQAVGASIFLETSKRFGLPGVESSRVYELILHHHDLHEAAAKQDSQELFEAVRRQNPDIIIDLAPHTLADTLPSHLKESNPEEYELRISALEEFLTSLER
jgi:UTP:GlnB (protein PII) uridylyltransferase